MYPNILELYSALDKLPVKLLKKTKQHIDKLLGDKIPEERVLVSNLDINQYVKYCNGFVSSEESFQLLACLRNEQSFCNSRGSNKPISLWLSRTNQPYTWESISSGQVTHNKALPISNFPDIDSMLDKINSELNSNLNSCLVMYYPNSSSGIRVHDDAEPSMDNNEPIAVVSLGTTRLIEFFHNYQSTSEQPVKSLSADNNSLYVMEAGCQSYFRHRVPSSSDSSGERFCLSFRHVLVPGDEKMLAGLAPTAPRLSLMMAQPPVLPTAPRLSLMMAPPPVHPEMIRSPPIHSSAPHEMLLSPPAQHTTSAPSIHVSPPYQDPNIFVARPTQANRPQFDSTHPNTQFDQQNRKITLLLGTSITKWVKSDTLCDGFTEFINISHSGAKIKNKSTGQSIPDFGDMVQNFAVTNPNKIAMVQQVILSLGTNDIKHFRQDNGRGNMATPGDLSVFYRPLINLIKSVRYHFGNSVRIYFQSVLPMRIMYTYTAQNFEGFNRLLESICKEMGCSYLDWFNMFLNPNGNDYNRDLFVDSVHLNKRGYDLIHKCLKYAVDTDRYACRL